MASVLASPLGFQQSCALASSADKLRLLHAQFDFAKRPIRFSCRAIVACPLCRRSFSKAALTSPLGQC